MRLTQVLVRLLGKANVEAIAAGVPLVVEAHHGGCVGADQVFHDLVGPMGAARHIHRSNLPEKFQGDCVEAAGDVVYDALPPLERNEVLVVAGEVLIACPRQMGRYRSGTWHAIGCGLRLKRAIIVIWPNGEEGVP